jgi:hypothetical protein
MKVEIADQECIVKAAHIRSMKLYLYIVIAVLFDEDLLF